MRPACPVHYVMTHKSADIDCDFARVIFALTSNPLVILYNHNIYAVLEKGSRQNTRHIRTDTYLNIRRSWNIVKLASDWDLRFDLPSIR